MWLVTFKEEDQVFNEIWLREKERTFSTYRQLKNFLEAAAESGMITGIKVFECKEIGVPNEE